MPRDPFIREKFTKEQKAARKHAQEYFERYPKIANDIGMSRQNVEHYMRFKDQMKVGADGQKRLRLVKRKD
jgi:hypothetical protein